MSKQTKNGFETLIHSSKGELRAMGLEKHFQHTTTRYYIISHLFLIGVERTQAIIMNVKGPFMDLIRPFVDITDVKGWSYGYADMFTPCRVKPDSGTFTCKR